MAEAVKIERKERRVAVCGTAPAHFHKAPIKDETWEIWGTAPGLAEAKPPRWDRWFEIHQPGVHIDAWPDHYMPFLEAGGKPVYSFHPLPIANQVDYPRAEIEERFGTEFLTSTIAWMLALAIHEAADVIGIWGVDMASDTEYSKQRAGCQHFLQLARHAGIDIHLPPQSHLLVKGLTYPDCGESPMVLRLNVRRQEIEEQLQAIKGQIETMRAAENQLQGRLEELDVIARILGL